MAERCARMFPSGIDGTLPPHQCKSRGSVEHEGKWYCKIHAHPFAKLGEIERLQALNAELVAALKQAREELQHCTHELWGEDFNNPGMNALIEKAESQ